MRQPFEAPPGATWKFGLSFLILTILVVPLAYAQSDPLPSWNDGAVKQAIIDFVKATTDPSSPDLVPAEERIATFDQDGTLWVEHPMYSQIVYVLDSVPALVKAKPELANEDPFKTVLTGDLEKIAQLPKEELEQLLAATLTGMTVDEFAERASAWLGTAKDYRWKRPYTDLTYQPMLEYTAAGEGRRLAMLLLHDDAEREYAYGPAKGLPDTKVGAFSQELYDEATKDDWVVISMKNDWKKVFTFE